MANPKELTLTLHDLINRLTTIRDHLDTLYPNADLTVVSMGHRVQDGLVQEFTFTVALPKERASSYTTYAQPGDWRHHT